jgi:tetratricopeptide (TPR) repeat protein
MPLSRPTPPSQHAVDVPPEAQLSSWNAAMERALRDENSDQALRIAHVILARYPRHLPTYYRLLRAAWFMRKWSQGDVWARRLLRADPSSALAWRAVAMATEQRGERAQAHARWLRAFECDPYEPDIRAGLVRTSMDVARLPVLNEACLAALHLRGYRWEMAARLYHSLIQIDPHRLDFQSGLLIAQWQMRTQSDAYPLARKLIQAQPHLLVGWVVIDDMGDVNDKALARHPLLSMDPDGDYVRSALGLLYTARPATIPVTASEMHLLA